VTAAGAKEHRDPRKSGKEPDDREDPGIRSFPVTSARPPRSDRWPQLAFGEIHAVFGPGRQNWRFPCGRHVADPNVEGPMHPRRPRTRHAITALSPVVTFFAPSSRAGAPIGEEEKEIGPRRAGARRLTARIDR
jgi:hypothetical protein